MPINTNPTNRLDLCSCTPSQQFQNEGPGGYTGIHHQHSVSWSCGGKANICRRGGIKRHCLPKFILIITDPLSFSILFFNMSPRYFDTFTSVIQFKGRNQKYPSELKMSAASGWGRDHLLACRVIIRPQRPNILPILSNTLNIPILRLRWISRSSSEALIAIRISRKASTVLCETLGIAFRSLKRGQHWEH